MCEKHVKVVDLLQSSMFNRTSGLKVTTRCLQCLMLPLASQGQLSSLTSPSERHQLAVSRWVRLCRLSAGSSPIAELFSDITPKSVLDHPGLDTDTTQNC